MWDVISTEVFQQPTPVFPPGKIPWTKEPGGLWSMGILCL